ncbi:hypothetical protein [Chitinophaga sp.]|uniref:hypothetical protein n=1 Tax=Chitinophaga sp. TaxID=1869181 RepID=UPI0031D048AF
MNRKRPKQIRLDQPEMEKKKADDNFPNAFAEMFWKVNNIPVEARELICKECDWSIPTFYRKLRAATRLRVGSDGKVRGVSSAELISIKSIYLKVFEDTLAQLKATDTRLPK